MAISSQFGFPNVPKSITNPNILKKDALDVGGPMSFLTFIKIISDSYSPESLQSYYNFYLKKWNSSNNLKVDNEKSLIIEKYRDFLKDINIHYTTSDERKFLSNINFNDPHDLDIALSFYSKKLREISLYYNEKRENLKFNIVKNKLRGTNYGIEKSLKDLTISYLKNLENSSTLFNIDEIIPKLDIQIEELYNTYSLYYNQTPDGTYDHKDLDYGYDIFLKSNQEIIDDVFSTLSDELLQLKEIDSLLDNKRDLTKKYLLTDFYYLSTGDTTSNFVSGKLFESSNNAINFSNRDYPTSVSKDRIDYFQTDKELGFFKPSKVSIVLVDGQNDSFTINVNNLQPNSLYYFPNPTILPKSSDILTFVVDSSFLKRNFSSGNSRNIPKSDQKDTKYYGYVSKIDQNKKKYLSDIFNEGYVEDIKYDINGNLLGLFKNDKSFIQYIQNIDTNNLYSQVINGHKFFDDLYLEGLNYNYTIIDDYTFNETKRSGLSSNTGTFISTKADLEINFGKFSPFFSLKEPTESNLVGKYRIIEGAYMADSRDIPYIDSVSSDLSAFSTSTDPFYFNTLIEGGIHTSTQRALLDATQPTLTANFTEYSRLSGLVTVDGGNFNSGDFGIDLKRIDYVYVDEESSNKTVLLSASEYFGEYEPDCGRIYIKNSKTREVLPLTVALGYLSTKYSPDVFQEIVDSVISFEIILDVLFIETTSYLIVDKIEPSGNIFKEPRVPSLIISKNLNNFERISNRFRIKNKVFYIRTKNITLDDESMYIYPEIYEFDTANFKNTKLYPTNTLSLTSTDTFRIPTNNYNYFELKKPRLTYSSSSDTFALSFILKDQNYMSDIFTYKFDILSNVNILSTEMYNSNILRYTNDMSSLSTVSIYLSGYTPTFEDNTLII
jgi:hypothetical protein